MRAPILAITSLEMPASLGVAGAGRDDHGLGPERLDFEDADLVVALERRVPPPTPPKYWTRLLSERIVVIDDEEHGEN